MNDENIIETTAVVLSNSSLTVTRKNLDDLAEKRKLLKEFVRSQLVEDVDFGKVPGCGDKPALLQPGAEKLGMLFQLRAEYDLVFKEIDIQNNFVMLSYKCRIVHIPSDKVVAECEAFCNSQEKKYAEKTEWTQHENGAKTTKKVPQKIADIINTISKMSQKRAYVGGITKATGASDFFTQDIEGEGDAEQLGLKPTTKGGLNFTADGETLPNKDKLRAFGGRWDGELKKWKFTNASQTTLDKVSALAGINVEKL